MQLRTTTPVTSPDVTKKLQGGTTVNTGDADTDALINKLVGALSNHGLISVS